MIMLRLKMQRRYGVFFWNVMFLMLCIEFLALTCFALDVTDNFADRLSLAITLVLTGVAFLEVVKSGLPTVPYLTYLDLFVLGGFSFLIAIMIETAFAAIFDKTRTFDFAFMWVCIAYQVLFHLFFAIYAWYLRQSEMLKLIMDSDEIESEVNLTRPALYFDFRSGKRQGNNNRLLAFQATKNKM